MWHIAIARAMVINYRERAFSSTTFTLRLNAGAADETATQINGAIRAAALLQAAATRRDSGKRCAVQEGDHAAEGLFWRVRPGEAGRKKAIRVRQARNLTAHHLGIRINASLLVRSTRTQYRTARAQQRPEIRARSGGGFLHEDHGPTGGWHSRST
jgi:hypothetical protein